MSVFVLALAAIGCSKDEPRHYSTPKESTAVGAALPAPSTPPESALPGATPMPMPGAANAMGAGLPVVEAPSAGAGLGWKLPAEWTEEKGSGMRFATIRTRDTPPASIAVVTLGGAAGGELANVNRWRGQVGLPPVDEAALAKERVTVKSAAGPIGVFDLVGEGQPASRLIAGILTVPNENTWFFKMSGDAQALAAAKPGFLRFLESVHRD